MQKKQTMGDGSVKSGRTKTWKRRHSEFEHFEYFYDEQREASLLNATSLIMLRLLKKLITLREVELGFNQQKNVLTRKVFQ